MISTVAPFLGLMGWLVVVIEMVVGFGVVVVLLRCGGESTATFS